MTWIPLLLADPSPNLRWLVLRELLDYPEEHQEVRELADLRESDQIVCGFLKSQQSDGSWSDRGNTDQNPVRKIRKTSQVLNLLGYLGFGKDFPAVEKGVEFLFSLQEADGSWPLQANWGGDKGLQTYSMIPLQTALPLQSLAACGYAADPRAECAYEWLLEQRLPDGVWPTGIAHDTYGRVGGYRRLAHSRWGCRSNTTGSLICFAKHPQRCESPEARQALDMLLGTELEESASIGFEVARTVGAEQYRGFLTFYARRDAGLTLDLCWRIGASLEDERVFELLEMVRSLQGAYGLWEYPRRLQFSRWVTFELMRSISNMGKNKDWISEEPQVPFQAYPKTDKRF